jgi:GNAT superfamily N-acetyltransferase
MIYVLAINNGKVFNWKDYEDNNDPFNRQWTRSDMEVNEGCIRYTIFDDYIELRQIYVREEDRKKGNGAKLLKEFERIAKKLKKDIFVFTTAGGNDNFFQFMVHEGYKNVGYLPTNSLGFRKKYEQI